MTVADIKRGWSSTRRDPLAAEPPKALVLGICCTALLVVGLDATIVNVALPSIHDSLGSSLAGLQWTVSAYTLVLGCLLMLAGSTADRVGRKQVFQAGLVVFAAGSLLCALAPSVPALVAARVVQAVGGSMLSPVAMSIIRNVFEDATERARAIGVYGAMFGLSLALGPVLGGLLVDSVGWRSVFLINVPVTAVAVVLTRLHVPESRAETPRRVDPIGQVLVIAVLAALTSAIIAAPGEGWGSLEVLALLAVAAGALAAFVPYEMRRREPLLELRFFRSVPFAGAAGIAFAAFAALGAFLFLNTLYLQDVRGLSPLRAGLALLPMATGVMVSALLSGRLVGARGARPSLLVASVAMALSLSVLTTVGAATPIGWLLGAYALFGIGFGFVNPPITNTAVSGMPPAQAGVAAAVASTSRQVGVTLGVAVVGAITGGEDALRRGGALRGCGAPGVGDDDRVGRPGAGAGRRVHQSLGRAHGRCSRQLDGAASAKPLRARGSARRGSWNAPGGRRPPSRSPACRPRPRDRRTRRGASSAPPGGGCGSAAGTARR